MTRVLRLASLACTVLSACGTAPDLTSDALDFGSIEEPLTGANGALAVTTANQVVNQYGVLAANAAIGATTITVTNAADFPATGAFATALGAGDLLMLYQPAGATIDATDTAAYGTVSALGGAGNYELIHVASVAGAVITLEAGCGGLKAAYTTAGLTEVIRVPQVTTLTVSGAGSITSATWDGARGGVVAIQAQTTATIGGGGIDVTGRGLRGGAIENVTTGPPGTTTIRSATAATGAEKGESIAGYQAVYDASFNGRYGRGAPANGGGGGDAHNAAGGGGANGNNGATWTGAGTMDGTVTGNAAWTLDPDYIANGNALTTSSGGGRGGYTYSATNLNATTSAPGAAGWNGDTRRNVGGLGGRPLANDPATHIFLGGGGGAGDGNNGVAGGGGNGGGLVVVLATTITGTGTILANGAAGTNSGNAAVTQSGDAPGGGGAGGTIVLAAKTLSGVTLHADGGGGGNQSFVGGTEAEGPGGGGGGGFIATLGGAVTATANGAAGGTSSGTAVTEFPTNGATRGAAGNAAAAVVTIPLCLTDDLSITNTDGKTTATPGTTSTYTIVVTNNGSDVITGATVADPFPAALTGVTWTCVASAGSTCPAASGNGSINASVTLAPGGTITYTATGTIAANATGTLSTTATVTAPGPIIDPAAGNNSATDSDTLSPSADVSVTVTAATNPIAPGGSETYTVTVGNAGPSDAQPVTLTDTLPPGSTFVSAAGTGWACSHVALVVTCTRPDVPPGGVPAITIVATAPSFGGPMTNTATATSTTADPNAVNNTATTITTVTGSADLAITISGAPDPVVAGAPLTYTVSVTNNGPGTAGNVTVTNTLPPGAGFTSATGTGWTCTQAGQVVTCTAPSLPTGAAPAITIVATAPAAGGTISDTVVVTSTTPDPNANNNSANVSLTDTASADLAVTVVATPDPVVAGAPVTYTVSVTNNGPSSAANVTVIDTLPPGTTFVSVMGTGWTCTQAGQVVTCTAPTLPTGAAPPITIIATAPPEGGPITDTVTVATTTADPSVGNNSGQTITQVSASADLAIAISAVPDPLTVNATLTYTVAVTNNGPSTATAVTVVETLPAGTTFVSATGSGWTCSASGQVVTCTVASLPTGDAPPITIVATTPPTMGTITTTATVSATTPDPTLTNNTASVDTSVTPSADLGITISATPATVAINGTVTLSLVVTDNGPSAATAVSVTDTLPATTTFVSASGTGWTCAPADGVVGCTAASLDASATSTITIVVTAPEGGPLVDAASVTSATFDPDPTNNAAAITLAADALGVRGGGCNAAGDSPASALLIVVVMMLGLVRRSPRARTRSLPALAVATGLFGVFATAPAHAQFAGTTQSFPVERLRVALDRDGIIGAEWAGVMAPGRWDVGTWLGYADDPLVIYDQVTDQRVGSLVHRRLGGAVFAAVGVTRWLELGIDAPLIYAQSNAVSEANLTSPTAPRLGDFRFVPKLLLRRGGLDRLGIALDVAFAVPTGGSRGYAGDDGVTFVPELVLSRALGAVRLAANLGYLARTLKTVLDLRVDDELQLKLGAGYRFKSPLELDAMFSVATAAAKPFSHENIDASEVDLAAQYDLAHGFTPFAGAGLGLGLGQGFGSPDWRLFVGVRYTRPAEVAALVTPPVPLLLDRDHDGILDADDKCPDQPEDKDGFQDADGCPDPDNDADGIPDVTDKCPNDPEDFDSFQDTDGCPDPDNDADGIPDAADKCPNQPGTSDNQGCPDPDRDGDGIVDRLDNCPDEKGTVENHGCAAKQLVTITNGKIELLDAVFFRTDKDIIENRSFAILVNVASVMASHPEIKLVRVEGHTDNRGGVKHNLDLSQRRAAAVVKFLVGKGVTKDRLEPVGFGQDKPIEDNTTDKGRAANRRVEFVIIGDQTGVDVKSTGPNGETIGK